MKKAELLQTEHHIQLQWLDNQISKIENEVNTSFLNVPVAVRAYHKLKNSLVPSNEKIEDFMLDHLNDTGTKKLVTTLRVYLKRNNAERLQVEITRSNKAKLDNLVIASGKTKIEIINFLISTANKKDFENKKITV